ncbi:MAG TPA: hypothetical protein VMV68_10955 [Spirochaetia bacterium]|nr:hypothetical protein [Spirochaetia bacterium]
MKKARLVLPVFLVLTTAAAFGVNFQDYGYAVSGSRQENNQTVYELSDKSGLSFTVASASELNDTSMKILGSILGTLESWNDMKIQQLKVVFSGNRADVLVMPSSFDYKGIDLAKYMPSGIQFYYDTYLQYDFRMLKDSLFLRLKGEVYGQSEFADRAYNALQNPVLYLQTNNPEYLLQRLNDIAAAVEKISNTLAEQEKTNKSTSDNLSALQSQDARLQAQDATLEKSVDSMRYATIALNNKGFLGLGRPKPVSQDAIDRVIALKQADPSMTKDQVSAKLKDAGVKLSDKELSLVFNVYFDDFK